MPFSFRELGSAGTANPSGTLYSQRKKRTARIVQSAATPSMTPIGSKTLPVLIPKNVCFLAVGKIVLRVCAAPHDTQALRFADGLYEDWLNA